MSRLEELSHSQGGRGVALRGQGPLGQLATELELGRSPGPGTLCTVFLGTLNDTAYDGATLNFYVQQFGVLALFGSVTISAADNANQPALTYTVSGCAADHWEVRIILNGATTLASLFSSVSAGGVENLPQGGNATGSSLTWTETFTGPGGTGPALFTLPSGTSVYIVTFNARIVSSLVDPVGDSYVTSETDAWQNTAGVVTYMIPSLSAPMVAPGSIMSTTSVGPATSSGTQAEIPFTLPAGLDPSTVTEVAVTLLPLSTVFL